VADRDVPNIIVLVGGTVDPGNTHPTQRSASYRNPQLPQSQDDADWYWGENPALWDTLERLRTTYNNLHLFTAHGWTGDNSANNRRIAGAYLADRLCGGNRERPYYPAFLQRDVSFHLIGHSHGGNVINELTRRAATSRDWPARWKIRSITYLSTPFFSRLHPVHTGVFHPDCRILNVFNRYDLTQRVIADFSLLPLNEVLKQAGISRVVEAFGALDFNSSLLSDAFLSVLTTLPRDADDSWFRTNLQLMMDPTRAARLYDAVLRLLGQFRGVLAQVRQVITRLNQGITFPVATEVRGKVTNERKIMSNALAQRFLHALGQLEAGLSPTELAFTARRRRGQYPLSGFFDDLHITQFLEPLIRFISVDRNTLRGPLCDLIHQLLVEQLDEFDNTSSSPVGQLQRTPFSGRVVQLDVSRKDRYSTKGKDTEFGRFISRLEGIETRYARSRSQTDLMDLLFTLLAHIEPLRAQVASWAGAADWLEGGTRFLAVRNRILSHLRLDQLSPRMQLIARLAQVVESYCVIFRTRHCGQLQVNDPNKHPPAYGSLDYFLRESHSISRLDLYAREPDVRTPLTSQFATRPRGGR
jgi:hypothetical protein